MASHALWKFCQPNLLEKPYIGKVPKPLQAALKENYRKPTYVQKILYIIDFVYTINVIPQFIDLVKNVFPINKTRVGKFNMNNHDYKNHVIIKSDSNPRNIIIKPK